MVRRRSAVPAALVPLLLAISVILATVVGLFGSASMVWRGSPGLSAPVAVTSAVSSGNTGSINASLCDVSPAHSRAPPSGVDGLIHTYYVLAGNTPVLVHNDACETALFGDGGVRAPRAPSYRGTDAGTFRTRDEAWAAANRDKANYRYSSPREECSPTGCHVHMDVYNNQGQPLETRHYT